MLCFTLASTTEFYSLSLPDALPIYGKLPASEPFSQNPQFQDTLGDIDLIKEAGNQFDLQ